MKFKIYISLVLLFIVSCTTAQTIEVKGKVTESNSNQQPLPFVNIVIKSTNKGVTTDLDGSYSIKANKNDILVYSSTAYFAKDIRVDKSQNLNVELLQSTNKLEEVVINVGYGVQKLKNLSSAITSVKADSFDDRPLYSVGQALQGNASGVNVVQPSGKPGVGLEIRIRGLSSIQSGNNPLYVIDGVQTYSTDGVSTDDIIDIQILKDAASTAIYGVNGSAGVVLITTKRGKSNKNIFSFNSYLGSSKIVKNVDVLNLEQFKTLALEISPSNTNALNPLYAGINTNWRDKVFQTGQDQNYDFSFSGGSDKLRAFTSLGYLDSKGIVKPSNFTRISGRLNLDLDATSWLKAHVNMNLIHTNRNNTSDNNSANQGGVILSALTTPAFLPVYADQLIGRILDPVTAEFADGQKDGQFAANPTASLENPVSFLSRQDVNNAIRYLGNINFDITLLKNLIWKPLSTIDISRSISEYFVDSYRSNYGRSVPPNLGIGRETIYNHKTWNIENTLNYAVKSDNNEVNLLVGNSMQQYRYDELRIEGNGFATDLRKLDLSKMAAINRQSSDTIARETNSVSYFGRATYIFKGKYIVNGVFRASGASQLAPNHKWGYFPGVSAAWIISGEDFLKNSNSISELKLRGGWGKTGNVSGIGSYSSYALLGDDHGTLQNYLNTDLTWETTTDMGIGMDVGIINNRVKLTFDAFQKTTSNLINVIPISGINYTYNAGKLENKGIEMAFNTINFKGDFNWSTNFNITFIENKVLEMGKNPIDYYGYQGINRVEKGVSLGNFYGYVVEGVNPANGLLDYKEISGDGIVTTQDRTVIGNALPKYTFGFTNTFSYEGLSLDLLFT
jgi:TonB-linked SusC/RagA family outer membrane protein